MTADFLTDLQNEDQRLRNSKNTNFLDNLVKMPKKGYVELRILPPAPGGAFQRTKSPFYQLTRTHKINGKNVHCPREVDPSDGKWKGNCPVCEYLRKLWADSEKADSLDLKNKMQASYRAIKAIERTYYNAVVVGQGGDIEQPNELNIPLIFSCGKTVHQMIIRGMVGDKDTNEPALGDVTNFKTGRTFKLMVLPKKGNDGNDYPDYSHKWLDPSPAGTPEMTDKWVAGMHDLVALRRLLSVNEIKDQLDIHLGLKADPAVAAPTTSSEPTVETKVVTQESSDDGSQALSDDDFLADLRKNVLAS